MTVSAPIKKEAPATQPIESAIPGRLKLAAQIIAWQIVAILAAELFLFMAGLGEEEIFRLDKSIGFTHMPNKRVTWRSEGYARSYFNEDGMREPGLTVEKPAGRYRVALLGDSMVEGLQVPVEKSFGQLLERSIKQSGTDIDVLNFATSGYSTAQECMQLKRQVIKYSPDLVILFYDNRDLFENWAPPDQTLTNVRPYALHLPGQPLVIDSSSVTQWMKSPRGKFLNQISWIRENSRIWGLIAAWETQASFHDSIYRAACALLTSPAKTIRAWGQSLSNFSTSVKLSELAPDKLIHKIFQSSSDKPSFKIQFFEDTEQAKSSQNLSQATTPGKKPSPAKDRGDRVFDLKSQPELASCLVNNPDLTSLPRTRSGVTPDKVKKAKTFDLKSQPELASCLVNDPDLTSLPRTRRDARPKTSAAAVQGGASKTEGQKVYVNLMKRTLASILDDMNKFCSYHQVRFAVVALPSKNALLARNDPSAAMMDLTYDREIETVSRLCREKDIPFADCYAPLLALAEEERNRLFISMHLHSRGHEFMAAQLRPFFCKLISEKQKK